MTSQTADLREGASGSARGEYIVAAKVSAAHFTSHVYFLGAAALFPLLKDQLHVGYVELGLGVTLFNILTVLLQAPMGFAVDRFDARSILVSGLCLGGFAFVLFAAVPTYPCLLIAAALAGIALTRYITRRTTSFFRRRFRRRASAASSRFTCSPAISAPPFHRLWCSCSRQSKVSGSPLPRLLSRLHCRGAARPRCYRALRQCAEIKTGPARAEPREFIFSVRVLTPAVLSLTGFFALISLSTTGIAISLGPDCRARKACRSPPRMQRSAAFCSPRARVARARRRHDCSPHDHHNAGGDRFRRDGDLVLLVVVLRYRAYRHSAFEHSRLLRVD